MRDLNYLFKCTVKDNSLPRNITEDFLINTLVKNVVSNELSAEKSYQLLVICVVLMCLLYIMISIEYYHIDFRIWKLKIINYFNTKTFERLVTILVIVMLLPVLVLLLVLALCYKVICYVILRNNDKRFVSFLDSFDVFWSLEDDSTKSVINVFGIVESDSPENVIENIKDKLISIIPHNYTSKLFYRRNENYGFYYWRRHNIIDMDEYVQIIEVPNNKRKLDESDLELLMSEISNQSLPYGDKGLFKILIINQKLQSTNKDKNEYGIIFRIHHSVGDGVALIEFLCNALADKSASSPIKFSMPESVNNNAPTNLLDMMQKLCEIPICFVDGILRKPDDNVLHGPRLLGQKVFKWTDSDENLLLMVNEIRDNMDTIKFSDVLATSLARGLENFFAKTMGPIPENLAVVLPIRFPKPQTMKTGRQELRLENDFSVTILDLPIKEATNINEIKKRCDLLRKSADPLTNYYFLKIVSSVFPKHILQPLLQSNQATMVFSNMPGPDTLTICGGNLLKSLVFFVPHKGTTGICVTALCYGGVLRFAASADTALVSNSDDLQTILDGMVGEIRSLHRKYVQ